MLPFSEGAVLLDDRGASKKLLKYCIKKVEVDQERSCNADCIQQ